jgi:hypothetical protein
MLALSPAQFNGTLTHALALGLAAVVATLSKPDASLAERRWATSALFRFKRIPVDQDSRATGGGSGATTDGSASVVREPSLSQANTATPLTVHSSSASRATDDGSASSVLSPPSHNSAPPLTTDVPRESRKGVPGETCKVSPAAQTNHATPIPCAKGETGTVSPAVQTSDATPIPCAEGATGPAVQPNHAAATASSPLPTAHSPLPSPISAECDALLTTLASANSTRDQLLAARRGLRNLLDRGSSVRATLSHHQLHVARSYLAPFG